MAKDYKSTRNISPEEFGFETRYVVLNFLGLVPAAGQSLNASRGSSNDSGSRRSSQMKDRATDSAGVPASNRYTPAEECSLKQVLPTLPEMSLTDKIKQHEEFSRKHQQPGLDSSHAQMEGDTCETNQFYDDEDSDSDDTIWRSATKVSITKSNESSEDEIVIPVKAEASNSDDSSLQIVKPASKPMEDNVGYNQQKEQDKMQGGTPFKVTDGTSTPEETCDGLDSGMLMKEAGKRYSPERPTTIDLVPDVSPPKPTLRYEKSKSPRRNKTNLVRTPTLDSEKSDISHDKSPRIKRGSSQKSPKPGLITQLSGSSNMTEMSEIDSLMLSVPSRSSRSGSAVYVDICHVDMEVLEKNKTILPEVIHLKEEIDVELAELEASKTQKFGDTSVAPPLSTRSMSLSPESKVAQYLSRIGDSVQEKYGGDLDRAFQTVVSNPDEMDYNVVSQAAGTLTQNTSGWTKVALVMLLGKKVAYGLLSRGVEGNVIHNVADYTTKILEDQVASFIINKGGWNSIQELEELESLCSEYSPTTQFIEDYDDQPPPLINPGTKYGDGDAIPLVFGTRMEYGNGESSPSNDYPDQSKIPPGMTTSVLSNDSSVQSESSTLVDNKDNNTSLSQGLSRNTSSDTLPSSLFSPLSDDNVKNDSLSYTELVEATHICNVSSDPPLEHNSKNDTLELQAPRHDSESSLHHGGASVKSFGFVIDSDCEEENGAYGGYDDTFNRQPSDCSSQNYSLVEGTMDIDYAVENIQRELYLLRQISNQYSEESEPDRKRRSLEKKIGLGLVIGALSVIGVLYIYKAFRKGKE